MSCTTAGWVAVVEGGRIHVTFLQKHISGVTPFHLPHTFHRPYHPFFMISLSMKNPHHQLPLDPTANHAHALKKPGSTAPYESLTWHKPAEKHCWIVEVGDFNHRKGVVLQFSLFGLLIHLLYLLHVSYRLLSHQVDR